MTNMATKTLIALSLFTVFSIGFLGRPEFDRITKPNLSDIHAAKVSTHLAITRQADTVLLGDSLTHWGEWSELLPGKSIANRGIAGDKLIQIFDRLPSVYQLHPKRIFITAGTNDLYKSETEQEAFRQYVSVIEDIRKHGITPVVQTTFLAGVQYKDSVEFNIRVNALNADLKKYCIENKLLFIDLNSSIDSDARVADGIHLSGDAYLKWASAISGRT